MALATILVHLDSSPRTAVRLALAIRLAMRFNARLTGLFAEMSEAYRVGVVATWPSAEHIAAAAAARSAFEAASAELGERARFTEVNRGSEQEILAQVTNLARAFDLVILGQPEQGVRVPVDLPEQVILESGRPVLTVPYAGAYEDVGRRPLFAWHHSRGATRALHDALPLIAGGAVALVVGARRPNEPVDEFADMIIAQLSAHGVPARFQSVVVDEIKLMDTLLNQAADHAADLLVLGAFDNAGFSFTGRGSGTRYILRHMTLPTLFSH